MNSFKNVNQCAIDKFDFLLAFFFTAYMIVQSNMFKCLFLSNFI